MLVFGRDGMGAFNRSKALDKLTKLAGRWYPVDGRERTGLDALWLDTEESTEESIEVDETAEVTEVLDAVRVIVRDESLGCIDDEGSGAGVREVGPTDLLLILFFEVDTGIMEAEVPGSRGFPGVWNAYAVDFGLVGEEGLDFACELAVGKAKPIDFRGFGVSGVDEDAEGDPSISFERQPQANNVYTYSHIMVHILLLLRLPPLSTASIRFGYLIRWTLLLLLQFMSLSTLCGG